MCELEKELKDIREIKDRLETSSDCKFKFGNLLKIPGEDNAFINIPNLPSVSVFKTEFEKYMKNFITSPINIINNEINKSIDESIDFDQNVIKKNYIILIKYLILSFHDAVISSLSEFMSENMRALMLETRARDEKAQSIHHPAKHVSQLTSFLQRFSQFRPV